VLLERGNMSISTSSKIGGDGRRRFVEEEGVGRHGKEL